MLQWTTMSGGVRFGLIVHHTDAEREGGFKRSSQHLFEGGCDEHSEAPITPFRTSAVAVTGTAASSGAI
jgi:hypothetical protein